MTATVKPVPAACLAYARLQQVDEPATVKLNLTKYGSTWSVGTTNEVGGGYGSSYSGVSLQAAVSIGLSHLPGDRAICIVVNDEDRGTYRRAL